MLDTYRKKVMMLGAEFDTHWFFKKMEICTGDDLLRTSKDKWNGWSGHRHTPTTEVETWDGRLSKKIARDN